MFCGNIGKFLHILENLTNFLLLVRSQKYILNGNITNLGWWGKLVHIVLFIIYRKNRILKRKYGI